MKKKVLLLTFLLILITNLSIYASSGSWIDGAMNFKPDPSGNGIVYLDDFVLKDIANLVEVAGTGIIAIATVVIGVKYLLGSVADKVSAKENLITLLVACFFFFGWSNIRTILIKGITFSNDGVVKSMNETAGLKILDMSNGFGGVFKSLFGITLTVAQMIAILATAYMGIKYVFGGAENKAKLKEKSIGYVIGIIMIFTTLNFLKFISSAINGMF